MIVIKLNPSNFENKYVNSLNECFNGWGNIEDYNWSFTRKVESFDSDIMIINSENEKELLAGSAVVYRKLSAPQLNKTIDIGIMSGSWTLPEARGKGCFTEIIKQSLIVTKQKQCEFLTAFVTKSNASYRRLENAGAKLVKSAYLFSPDTQFEVKSTNISVEEINLSKVDDYLSELMKRREILLKNKIGFFYTHDSFLTQYINRKGKIQLLKLGVDFAIVEETKDKIKVHLLTYSNINEFEILMRLIVNWALETKNKNVIYFSTISEVTECCLKMNFDSVDGFYTVMQPGNQEEKMNVFNDVAIDIQMGDKM